MSETVLSIPCGIWNLDSEEEMQMVFYKDGTGDVSLSSISTPSHILLNNPKDNSASYIQRADRCRD